MADNSAVHIAFKELRELSRTCNNSMAAFHKNLESMLATVDAHTAVINDEIAVQNATSWFLQKGNDYQQGLSNTLARLRRGRSAATRLDRSMRPDPCMVAIIEKMARDWKRVVEDGSGGAL